MNFSVIDFELVLKLLLLLLIGMGPKIALVPFLEKTKNFDAETQRAVGRRMVVTAVVTALVIFALGGLLMRLLHITGGAVAVAGGIILARGIRLFDLCQHRQAVKTPKSHRSGYL